MTHSPNQTLLLRYEINSRLTLAGQPQPADWAALAAEGFAAVVNLRSDPTRAALQQRNAEPAGLHSIHLPLPAYALEPEHLALFHQTMAALPGRVLLHCRSGTRVALLWLLEQQVFGGWSRAQAEQVLRAAGYDDDTLATLHFCADDYFERAGLPTVCQG
ncbi:MAG: protein tyrosine phosphatase family protein [Roseiflexaceae bacterium]